MAPSCGLRPSPLPLRPQFLSIESEPLLDPLLNGHEGSRVLGRGWGRWGGSS